MPEGDSIFRVAALLRPLIVGKPLLRVRTQGLERAALAGRPVRAVAPTGKHLVIELDGDTTIRSHLGMNGRWRRWPPGGGADVERIPAGDRSLELHTETDLLVCLGAREVEIRDRRDPRHGRALARLGPDILGADFDPAVAAARARALGARPVGDVLLDQQVAAGIGNIYRCEALFRRGVHPATPVAALSDDSLIALYREASTLMRANLGPGPRSTRGHGPERYHVYRRVGRPCPRCGERVASDTQGEAARRIYWCPRCQPAPDAALSC